MPSVTWDAAFELSPADTDEAKYGATRIRELKLAISERLELELNFKTGTQPLLKAGKAAVCYSGNTAAIDALTGMSAGALAHDTDLNVLKRYSGSAWVVLISVPVSEFVGTIRGLEVTRKDNDEVYVSGGVIHVNDGTTDHLLKADAQLTKAITGHGLTDVPIYFYIDAPASGDALANADVEYHADPPVWDAAKMGWYNGTNTDWRFIGSIPVDGSGNLIVGNRSGSGNRYEFDSQTQLYSGVTMPAVTFEDIPNIENFMPAIDNAIAELWITLYNTAGTTKSVEVRKNGSSGSGQRVLNVLADASGENTIRTSLDANGKAEWNASVTTTGVIMAYATGYWEPR